MIEIQEQLEQDIFGYTADPLGFVRFAYDWGEGEMAQFSGPRTWQANVLDTIGKHLRDPETRFQPCRVAISSGHGIGKDAFAAMLLGWAMSTCEDCKVAITANTEAQLRTKTWPELAKWHSLSINKHWFKLGDTSLTARVPNHEKTWRADRLTWSENNTEAFQGLHNQRKRILVVFTEASGIADKVWEVTEGALTDEDTEIIWVVLGNPTQPSGRFFECFGKQKHRWYTFQVDSRTVEGTNKAELGKWVDDYGEDSDFVRVRVRGEFPRSGSNQLISSEDVAAARKYKATGFDSLPKILSVDVARFGDDQTVIGMRQGRHAVILGKYRGLDTVQTADKAQEFIDRERPDATVVDGDGLGAGVIDTLNHRNYTNIHEFHGNGTPSDPHKYFNKRAEVWGEMGDWLKAGAQIPDDPELATDLTAPQYRYSASQQIQLERKEDMKKRGLASPDCGDMLAMTFSVKVLPKPRPKPRAPQGQHAWLS